MLTVGSLFSGIGGFDLAAEHAGLRVAWRGMALAAPGRGGGMTLPPADPCRCPDCGLGFVAPIVRSAHSLMGTRCLTAAELGARGWRQLPDGLWAFPGPQWVDYRRGGPVDWSALTALVGDAA